MRPDDRPHRLRQFAPALGAAIPDWKGPGLSENSGAGDVHTAAIGADNIFDAYPRQISPALNTTGAAPFTSFSPFGFEGRFVYGRLSVKW